MSSLIATIIMMTMVMSMLNTKNVNSFVDVGDNGDIECLFSLTGKT